MRRASGFVVAIGLWACGSGEPARCDRPEDPCSDPDARGAVDAAPPDLTDVTIDLRVQPMIAADGSTAVPVVITAVHADGSPVVASFVLATARDAAGTFEPSTVTLGAAGGEAVFTPCDAATAGCAGPLGITLAPAWDATTVVAEAQTELVEVEVGELAPCLGFTNRMYFDGTGSIWDGILTVDDAIWSATASPQFAGVYNVPTDPAQGLWWNLEFSSEALGAELARGVYEMAERFPFESPGHPGMSVTGNGSGCNTISGRFQVFRLAADGDVVESVIVSFEQHCEQSAEWVLYGCVQYAPQP